MAEVTPTLVAKPFVKLGDGGFGAYYKQNFGSVDGATLQCIYKKFPVAERMAPLATMPPIADFAQLPSVGTWVGYIGKKHPPKMEETPARPFHMLPSVGSWCAAFPLKRAAALESAPPPAAAVLAPPGPADAFRNQPSVGSWLVKKPAQVERPWYMTPIEDPQVAEMQKIIAEKDAELEALRAMVANLQERRSKR